MFARGDLLNLVIAFNMKFQPPPRHRDEFNLGDDLATRRRRRAVAHIDMGAEGLLPRPVEMGDDRLLACPLKKADHETGGENRRHLPQLRRLRIQRRHHLALRQREPMLKSDAGFKGLFHVVFPLSAPGSGLSPASRFTCSTLEITLPWAKRVVVTASSLSCSALRTMFPPSSATMA